jgi:hypothetical protein
MRATKVISWLVAPVIVFMFLTLPYLEAKAYADNFQPPPTDLSQPEFLDMFSFTRMMGKEEAVYFSIPASQVSSLIPLPSDPSPFILAKYEREKTVGSIFVMRIWQAGPWMRGEILRITPRNWQHFMGTHFYNFAFLIPKNQNCYINPVEGPGVDKVNEVAQAFAEYDYKVKELIDQGWDPNIARNAVRDPTPFLRNAIGNPYYYNNSDLYWFERLNDDTNCWDKVGAGDYDKGDSEFHDISEPAFYNMVSLAMEIHKAGAGLIMFPKYRQEVEKKTKKGAFRKKVTITVRYFVYPEYVMVFPHKVSESYGNFRTNPGNSPASNMYDFVTVTGNHTFPVDEFLVYQWSKTKSGWTGLAVFLGSLLIGMFTAGIGNLFSGGGFIGILEGAAIGGIGGLIASGFSPTTSVTAHFTPFVYSKYQLDPSAAWEGNAKKVADETFDKWLRPDVQNTPGGVGVFVSRIDMRKAVLCGSPSNTDNCNPEVDQPVVQVHGTDPRFWSIFNEMFHHASQELMKYKYPFEAPAR